MEEEDGSEDEGPSPQLHVYVLDGSLTVGGRSSANRGLDASLWSKLPAELLEKVLLTLPPLSQYRFRIVCKKWLLLLSSPSVMRESASLARSQDVTICAFRYRPRPLVNPVQGSLTSPRPQAQQLHKFDLSFLPSAFLVRRFDGIVAQDGWICVMVRDAVVVEVQHFCVFNPVTRTCRTLPDLNVDQQGFGCMTVRADRSSRGDFEVTVVCGDEFTGPNVWTVAVYCSRDGIGAWKVRSSEPAVGFGFSNCCIVLSKGLVCSFDCHASKFLFHCVDARVIKRGYLRRPEFGTSVLANFRLVEHVGRILFVGVFVQDNDPCCGIWGLDEDRMVWEPLSQMNDLLRRDSTENVREQQADYEVEVNLASLGGVAVVGETIFMSIYTQAVPRHFARYRTLMTWSHVMGFNISQKSWKTYMQDAGDIVRTELVTMTGFLQLRMNDFLL